MSNSCEVSFYQISFTPLEKVLPKLVEKIYDGLGLNCFILCDSEAQMKALDSALWTAGRHFLPHDTLPCERAVDQPILLGTELQNHNNSEVLVVLKNHIEEDSKFKRVIDLFNGFSHEETQLARQRYKHYRQANLPLKFWKQDANGSWAAV